MHDMPTSLEDENAQLERAIRESLAMAGRVGGGGAAEPTAATETLAPTSAGAAGLADMVMPAMTAQAAPAAADASEAVQPRRIAPGRGDGGVDGHASWAAARTAGQEHGRLRRQEAAEREAPADGLAPVPYTERVRAAMEAIARYQNQAAMLAPNYARPGAVDPTAVRAMGRGAGLHAHQHLQQQPYFTGLNPFATPLIGNGEPLSYPRPNNDADRASMAAAMAMLAGLPGSPPVPWPVQQVPGGHPINPTALTASARPGLLGIQQPAAQPRQRTSAEVAAAPGAQLANRRARRARR